MRILGWLCILLGFVLLTIRVFDPDPQLDGLAIVGLANVSIGALLVLLAEGRDG
jgi:hypothetical protein